MILIMGMCHTMTWQHVIQLRRVYSSCGVQF